MVEKSKKQFSQSANCSDEPGRWSCFRRDWLFFLPLNCVSVLQLDCGVVFAGLEYPLFYKLVLLLDFVLRRFLLEAFCRLKVVLITVCELGWSRLFVFLPAVPSAVLRLVKQGSADIRNRGALLVCEFLCLAESE